MPSDLVRRVKHYIETHLARITDAQEVADALDVSLETLNERFQQVEGVKLSAYLRQSRVTYLKLYLSATYLAEDQVAQRVGFPDTETANRVFKKTTNYTMEQYRRLFQLEVDS
jgi:two-component system response regulator YesN